MDARLDVFEDPTAREFLRRTISAGRAVMSAPLPAATQELVAMRASQINGCAFCADRNTAEAAAGGETAVRSHMIATWRGAGVFTAAERAALELTEQGTRAADTAGGVTSEAWGQATRHFDEDQLAALASLISLMNSVNRWNALARQPAGDHQPGRFA